MVSGLNSGERIDLGVGRYTQDFILLRDFLEPRGCKEEEEEYSNRFKTWRESLAVLGINFRNLMNSKKFLSTKSITNLNGIASAYAFKETVSVI